MLSGLRVWTVANLRLALDLLAERAYSIRLVLRVLELF